MIRYFQDKIDLNLDCNVQSVAIQKFGISIVYTYYIFVLINQISNFHQAKQNKFYENRVIVAQVIGTSNFPLFAISRIRQNPTTVAKIIIRDSYEDFQIFTQRKRNESEPWNFYSDFSS